MSEALAAQPKLGAVDMPSHEWFARLMGIVALLLGSAAAWIYHRAGLTLTHYDAKAHLVVARRVIDSITPGWQQVGAIWLPLPHLLDLIPVQVDAFYRTGASAVVISVLAFGLAAYATARLILLLTRSRLAALSGTAVLVLNPDVLYLQATPMTEPLLLGLTTLAIALIAEWVEHQRPQTLRAAGWTVAAACLTRYEAWPVTATALAAVVFALWRRGRTIGNSLRQTSRLAVYPAVAVLLFLLLSRTTTGEWFVVGGFYVPDNPDQGRPLRAVGSVWWGTHLLTGYGVLALAVIGALATLGAALLRRSRAAAIVPLALVASAALPWYAFVLGHPFRIRYMVPMVSALAVTAGVGVGLARRWRFVAAVVLVATLIYETRPFDFRAPMLLEAQWDSENSAARRTITEYLVHHYRQDKILTSMASLAHYMQELSQVGFDIADFVHEGNGDLWWAALAGPRLHVGWILIEESSEGGDKLARLARENPRFLDGFVRVSEGGGVALYRRVAEP